MPYYENRDEETFFGPAAVLLNSDSSSLVKACGQQDQVFEAAYAVLQEAIDQRAFPAASVSVSLEDRVIGFKAFGRFTYEIDSPTVVPATLFDLASLTKVVATTSMAMILYERGLLDLDAPVAAIVSEFISDLEKDLRRHDVTLRMLLTHSSGLPAYEKLFLKAHTRDPLLGAAFTAPLAADPGSRAVYSDIGFIVL